MHFTRILPILSITCKNNCLFSLIIHYILLILWYLYFIFTHTISCLRSVVFTLFDNSHFAHITIRLIIHICEFHVLYSGIYLDIYISILFDYFVKNSHPYSFSLKLCHAYTNSRELNILHQSVQFTEYSILVNHHK